MSYEKQNFTSGMLLTADHLNHMEEGIANAGPVKTVNGVSPDENGDVEIVIEAGATSWNDLEDKPFGEAVEEAVVFEEQSFEASTGTHAYSGDIESGQAYAIYYNGVRYEDIGHFDGGSAFAVGGNDYPFVIKSSILGEYDPYVSSNSGEAFTLKVAKIETVIKQLSDEYIPNNIQRVGEISWNDLNDKPFYDDSYKVVWTGSPVHDDVNGTYRYVSSLTPSKDELVGATYTYSSVTEGSYSYTVDTLTSNSDETGYNCYYIYVALQDNVTVNNIVLPYAGIYFKYSDGGNSYVTELEWGNGTQTIDEKFIPDTIQRVGEAITLTSPNGTQYTLNVSNDGTLSATVVTA